MITTYRVILLAEAFDDIDRIVEYIKRDSPQNAAAVLDRLWKAAQSLSILPHRCKIHRSSKDATRIIRSMVVWPFIVYYRVLDRHRTVEVLTIRHGSRRQPRRFRLR